MVQHIKVFFNLKQPCNFPGCESLRTQYKQELIKAQQGKGCAACARMAVNRKYKQMLERRMAM